MKLRPRSNLLKSLPNGSVCAEIGVWRGEFSISILQNKNPRTLYLIDPWKFMPEYKNRIYGGMEANSQRDMDAIYNNVLKLRDRFPNVRVIRDTSLNASKRFSDNFFDWVYIDGNHSYQYVKIDLATYWKKIKVGGCLALDDYVHAPGVKKAVNEFVYKSRCQCKMVDDQVVLHKQENANV